MVSVRKSYRTSMVVMSLTNAPAEGVVGEGERRGGEEGCPLVYFMFWNP